MSDSPAVSDRLLKALHQFPVIELEDLPEGAQMERVDRKFPFHISQVTEVLEGLQSEYKIVRAGGSIVSPYRSWYMDTPDYQFFKKHHNGILNRDKVRYRAYPNTNTTFLEVKRKNNKRRTSKARMLCSAMDYPFQSHQLEFLGENLPGIDPRILKPSVFIRYDRIAFTHQDGKERFSIDFNLTADKNGKRTSFGEAVILEVMQDRKFTSAIIARLHELRLREGSISKYCMTLSSLNSDLKSNLFKPNLRSLEKIMNE